MAGDIGIQEQAIILAPGIEATDEAAAAPLAQATGRVRHLYGPRVVIAEVPADAAAAAASLSGLAVEAGAPGVFAEEDELDQEGSLGLLAFGLRQSDVYEAAKAKRPHAGAAWDEGDIHPPDAHEAHEEEHEALAAAPSSGPTSARLTGSVAVGIIIVEGPTNALKFSQEERTKVVAEVQNGLSWLGSYSNPAGITWMYDINVVTLTTKPGASTLSFAEKEARWRDPAMKQLGYNAGMSNVQKYVEDLRDKKKSDWAYCVFFTKYPVGHFAYASIGGPRMVMHYDNDGWGPDNIDRVFAHETGHIFGAPDEYASSNCNCGGKWGFYQTANSNCENCAGGGGVACIMKSNSWEMCAHTPRHLGFPQEDVYSGVWLPGNDKYGIWLNASWGAFRDKWREWSGQGLRLAALDVTETDQGLRYSGVWRQGGGRYGLWVNASWSSFLDRWRDWGKRGLRLVDVDITGSGNNRRYSGVWQQGDDPYGLWVNASFQSFVEKWREWNKRGLRLISLEVTPVGDSLRYSGVWRKGSGGSALWLNASWDSFKQKWEEWAARDLRLLDIEVTQVGNELRYSGIWGVGTGKYGLWVNSDWASFKEKLETWDEQGMRLVDIRVGARRAAGAPAAALGSSEMNTGGAETVTEAAGEEVGGEAAGFGELFGTEPEATTVSEGFGDIFQAEAAGPVNGDGFGELLLDEEPFAADGGGIGEAFLEEEETEDEDESGSGAITAAGRGEASPA